MCGRVLQWHLWWRNTWKIISIHWAWRAKFKIQVLLHINLYLVTKVTNVTIIVFWHYSILSAGIVEVLQKTGIAYIFKHSLQTKHFEGKKDMQPQQTTILHETLFSQMLGQCKLVHVCFTFEWTMPKGLPILLHDLKLAVLSVQGQIKINSPRQM